MFIVLPKDKNSSSIFIVLPKGRNSSSMFIVLPKGRNSKLDVIKPCQLVEEPGQ